MSQFHTDPTPPKRNGIMWVERIAGNERQQFTIYSQAIFGIWTHYMRSGTRPCMLDHDLCEGGHTEETLRWKGYVHAWSFKMNRPVVLQLTAAACDLWLQQLASKATMRGQRIEVWRTKSDNGRVRVAVNEYLADQGDRLPPPADLMPSLFSLWKMNPVILKPDAKEIRRKSELPPESLAS